MRTRHHALLAAGLLPLVLLLSPGGLHGQHGQHVHLANDSLRLALSAPTASDVAWLKARAVPLRTTTPGASSGDLDAVDRLVGDASIVGLGEGTHGTREFSHLKHRIVEYLAREKGFTLFAIEANMPDDAPVGPARPTLDAGRSSGGRGG